MWRLRLRCLYYVYSEAHLASKTTSNESLHVIYNLFAPPFRYDCRLNLGDYSLRRFLGSRPVIGTYFCRIRGKKRWKWWGGWGWRRLLFCYGAVLFKRPRPEIAHEKTEATAMIRNLNSSRPTTGDGCTGRRCANRWCNHCGVGELTPRKSTFRVMVRDLYWKILILEETDSHRGEKKNVRWTATGTMDETDDFCKRGESLKQVMMGADPKWLRSL